MAKRQKKQNRSQENAPATQPQAQGTLPLTDRKLFLIRVALIVTVGFWVFSPALPGSWLWDDDVLITKNEIVHDPLGLWKIWFEPTSSLVDYFPLTVSAEWLQCQLWQDNLFGYHLVSVILHLVSSLLIWRLLSKLGLRLAWLGGLLFAVHPIVVESVAWISELKNTLSLPLFLWAMCRWIDYDERGNRRDYFWALGLFLAAMLGKTTMVMFPAVILLYAWWKRDRVSRNDLKASAPFFAISLVLGLVTVWFLHAHAIGKNAIPMGGFFSHLALAGLSMAFYFSKCFWPVDLLPIYPKWEIDPVSPVQFIPWLVLGGVLYWLWRKRAGWGRHALLGLGFFLINLAPFIGLTAASYMEFTWVMDHLLYLPLIGLIGLVTAALGQFEQSLSGAARPMALGIMTVIMALLAWESHEHAGVYVSEEALWAYTIKLNPEAWMAHNNLGAALLAAKRTPEAIEQFEEAFALNPAYSTAHYNLGNALRQSDRIPEAIEQYRKTLEIAPEDLNARNNLGMVLLQFNQIPEAMGQFEQALKIDPRNAKAHGNLGNALFQINRLPEALDQYEQAIKLDPTNARVRNKLGTILVQTNHYPEAIEQFRQALQIDPDFAEVHYNLGNALAQTNQTPEAIEQYEQAIKINPTYVEAFSNLGNTLLQANRIPEAIAQYQQAIKLNPNFADAHGNLGIALMQTNRLPEAIDQYEQAIKLNPSFVEAHGNLSTALIQAGRISEAIEQCELALKLTPNDVELQNQLTRLKGLPHTAPAGRSSAK